MVKSKNKFKPLSDAEIKKMIEDVNFDPDAKNLDLQDIDDELLINQMHKDFKEDWPFFKLLYYTPTHKCGLFYLL